MIQVDCISLDACNGIILFLLFIKFKHTVKHKDILKRCECQMEHIFKDVFGGLFGHGAIAHSHSQRPCLEFFPWIN